MKKLITYFIKYPIAVNILMAVFFIFGFFAYQQLTSTFFPVTDSKIILVQAIYPGASPEEIEEGIVNKIEDNLKGVEGVERVTSVSQENSGTVTVEVLQDYQANEVIDDVRNAVDRIPSFPDGMEPPVVFVQDFINFTINFAISGADATLETLKHYARQIEDDLRAIPGISQIAILGYPEEEIEIAVSEYKLQSYQIRIDEVLAAVRNANIRLTGGTIKGSDEEFLIRVNEKQYYAEQLAGIVVKAMDGGQFVRLGDIAELRNRWEDNPNRIEVNGKPGVEITLSNTNSEDILSTADAVLSYLETFQIEHPDITVDIIRNQAITLNDRRDLLVENGIIGVVLVVLLLSLFLHPSLAFWVAASLPVSFFGMFILANFFDVTINVISLFGMIVVIGILVDDGIVVGENIYQHFERGKNPLKAAVDGILEVLPAVFSALLTTIIAFSTFFFLDGRSGEFFSEMAIVVVGTLTISLIEVILILPAHIAHSRALTQGKIKKTWLETQGNRLIYLMRDRTYEPLLRRALKYKALTMSIFIGLFVITLGAFSGGIIKATYFPTIERENIDVNLKMPSGTSERITNSLLDQIEIAAWRVDSMYSSKRTDGEHVIQSIVRKIGPTIDQGSLNIVLLNSEMREASAFEVTGAVRDAVGMLPTAEKLTFGTASPFGKPVSVSLLGNNLDELNKAKALLKAELMSQSNLRDVVDNDLQGYKEVTIELKEKAHLLGLSLFEVSRQVRQAFYGAEVQRLQRGLDEVKVWVRFAESERQTLANLNQMRIRTPSGAEIPFSEIARYEIERGTVSINHLNGRREIRIEADLSNPKESAVDINAAIQEEILPPILAQFPSVGFSFEGQNREAQKTQKSGKQVMPVILILIIVVITFTFRSFGQTLIIFLLIPFSFIGVSWGHWLHETPLSLFSYLGIIALVGIIVNDSLVLVSKMNGFLKEGYTFDEAVYKAGLVRFRAIFLTSITTVAGLAPLILEKSFQAQFLVPMAISVAYGILMATFITLLGLPVMLAVKNEVVRRFKWAWNWEKGAPLPSKESVESVIRERKWEKLEKTYD